MSKHLDLDVGLVVAGHGRHYIVETPEGRRLICHPRGKKSDCVVGDHVRWQPTTSNGDGEGVIEAPNWTPDGQALVFNAGGELWSMPPDGSAAPQKIDTGSRRDLYQMPSDWYALMVRNSPIYGVLADQAEAGLVAVGDPDSPATERLRDMAGFYRFLQGRVPEIIAEWETVRAQREA